MTYSGTLIVVNDCTRALKFYSDMFELALIRDNGGNMELTDHLYLQERRYWEKFTDRNVITRNNSTELYFEEQDIEAFVDKLEMEQLEDVVTKSELADMMNGFVNNEDNGWLMFNTKYCSADAAYSFIAKQRNLFIWLTTI